VDAWLRLSRALDRGSAVLGHAVAWLSVALVLLGAGNALARHAGRLVGRSLASNALLEGQWYLFSVLFLLGAAWTLRQDRHVRVDVLHARLSARARAWIDLVGSLVLLLPTCVACLWLSWPAVRNSVAVREVSSDPGGLPRWPIKALLLVAFALLALQGLSEAIRRVAFLAGRVPSPEPASEDEELAPPGGQGAA
jgi:TRAP-type mannitol/chloroaromatic compound transport system permease small subunit